MFSMLLNKELDIENNKKLTKGKLMSLNSQFDAIIRKIKYQNNIKNVMKCERMWLQQFNLLRKTFIN